MSYDEAIAALAVDAVKGYREFLKENPELVPETVDQAVEMVMGNVTEVESDIRNAVYTVFYNEEHGHE